MQRIAMMVAAGLIVAACLPKAEVATGPSGAEDFATFCVACHGDTGKGVGAVAAVLTRPPADLTQLSASNGGKFPAARVMSKVWGYTTTPPEAEVIMPNFSDLLEGETVLYDSGDGIATPTPLRLVQLAEYVQGLQE